MRRKCLPAAAATAAALAFAAPSLGSLLPAERSLLGELNRVRAEHGLAPFRVDSALQRSARAHSVDMIRRDYFDHGALQSRLQAAGARGPVFAENLAWGVGPQASAAAITRLWLRSPGHRGNLLRPGFHRIGIAAPRGEFLGRRGARVVTLDLAGE